jgi:hypothetical protein
MLFNKDTSLNLSIKNDQNMDNNYLGVGSRVKHPAFGDGVIIKLYAISYDVCFMLYGVKQVGKEYDKWEIIEHLAAEDSVTYSEAEKSLIRILKNYNLIQDNPSLGDRWKKGIMILQPFDTSLKSKEIPMETFFQKIIMSRERIRVMEQKINNHPVLSDEDKITLQQYITKIYGSFTSFNLLFEKKEDYFVGEKSV